jgi:tRNA modification GTPase
VRDADLALVIVDAHETGKGIGAADAGILAGLPERLPRLVVHNKIDLAGVPARVAPGTHSDGAGAPVRCHVWLCAKSGEGVELLRREMLATVGLAENLEGSFLAHERHLAALREAAQHLAAAGGLLAGDAAPLELFAEELREAQVALSRITGAFTADDLLGEIFSRFCIGK